MISGTNSRFRISIRKNIPSRRNTVFPGRTKSGIKVPKKLFGPRAVPVPFVGIPDDRQHQQGKFFVGNRYLPGFAFRCQQFITEGTIDHQFAEVLKQYRIVQGKKGQYAQITPFLRKAGQRPDNVGVGSDGENDRAVFRLIQPGNGRKRANQGTGSFRIIFCDERLKQGRTENSGPVIRRLQDRFVPGRFDLPPKHWNGFFPIRRKQPKGNQNKIMRNFIQRLIVYLSLYIEKADRL